MVASGVWALGCSQVCVHDRRVLEGQGGSGSSNINPLDFPRREDRVNEREKWTQIRCMLSGEIAPSPRGRRTRSFSPTFQGGRRGRKFPPAELRHTEHRGSRVQGWVGRFTGEPPGGRCQPPASTGAGYTSEASSAFGAGETLMSWLGCLHAAPISGGDRGIPGPSTDRTARRHSHPVTPSHPTSRKGSSVRSHTQHITGQCPVSCWG